MRMESEREHTMRWVAEGVTANISKCIYGREQLNGVQASAVMVSPSYRACQCFFFDAFARSYPLHPCQLLPGRDVREERIFAQACCKNAAILTEAHAAS